MKKNFLMVLGLILWTILLACVFTTPARSGDPPVAGTCCYQPTALCVVGNNSYADRYYLASGPCP